MLPVWYALPAPNDKVKKHTEHPDCLLHQAEHRGIMLQQLRELVHETCTVDTMTWYDFVKYHVKPATDQEPTKSYVELKAPKGTRAQTPKWFISFWFGMPVKDSLACLEEHARVRQLSAEDAVYWISVFAFPQQDVGQVAPDGMDSDFIKTMRECDGVLVLIDRDAAIWTRMWCAFEQATVVSDKVGKKLLLDFATVHRGKAQLLTQGLAYKTEARQMKAARERGFPLELMEHGYTIEITKAEATYEEDKRHILNSIAGRESYPAGIASNDSAPDLPSPEFDRVNNALRSMLGEHAALKSEEAGKLQQALKVATAGKTREGARFRRRDGVRKRHGRSRFRDVSQSPLIRKCSM